MIKLHNFILTYPKDLCKQIALCPDNAMDWLAWCASDSAHGIAFRCFFRIAIVAFRFTLDYHLHLSVEASCSGLDQWDLGCQTHSIHMPPRIKIVQCIKYDTKLRKPFDIELCILDIGVIRFEFDVRVEFGSSILSNLRSR